MVRQRDEGGERWQLHGSSHSTESAKNGWKRRSGRWKKAVDPTSVPATEIVVLHDPDAQRSVVILFFDSEDDYKRGDEALNAMPAADTPGQRTSVAKYEVASRLDRIVLRGSTPASGAKKALPC